MILNMFFLVCALCLDMFVTSAAYGADKMQFSWKQIAAVNLISSLCLGSALLFGSLLDALVPETFTREICFVSLLLLGGWKLMDSGIRRFLRKRCSIQKKINFTCSRLHFIVSIYSDPMEADADEDHMLSWRELLFFALAMSLDNLIAGTLAAFMKIPVPLTVGMTFLTGVAFTCAGLFLGRRIGRTCPGDLSWVGGVLFIILAFARHR